MATVYLVVGVAMSRVARRCCKSLFVLTASHNLSNFSLAHSLTLLHCYCLLPVGYLSSSFFHFYLLVSFLIGWPVTNLHYQPLPPVYRMLLLPPQVGSRSPKFSFANRYPCTPHVINFYLFASRPRQSVFSFWIAHLCNNVHAIRLRKVSILSNIRRLKFIFHITIPWKTVLKKTL